MFLSVFMGPFARGPRDDKATIDYCLDGAVKAAEAGFALVTFGEQHFNNYEPYCNPFLMGARLSPRLGATYFGTSMCPLPYHNPILLAETINVLDQLLEGRLIVGFSQGRVGFSPDFENFGLDPKDQKEIFAEKFETLMALWKHRVEDGPLKFDGRWVKGGLHGRLMPASYRAPHPQYAIGTNTDATCTRTGRQGAILSLGPTPLEDAARKFDLYRAGLDEGGYDEAYRRECLDKSMVHHQVVVRATDDEAWEAAETMGGMNPLLRRDLDQRTLRQMHADATSGKTGLSEQELKNNGFVRGWFIVGSPDTVAAELKAHEDAGIRNVLTRFTIGMYNPPMWDLSFRLFVDEVMPVLSPQSFAPPSGAQVQSAVSAGPLPVGGAPAGYGAQDPAKFREQTQAAS